MAWNSGLTKLQEILSELYPTVELSRPLVIRANVPTGRIAFTAASDTNWFSILEEADRHKMVPDIVACAQEEFKASKEELAAAVQEYLQPAETDHHIDPGQRQETIPEDPPVAVVRELLLAAFSADDLRRLIQYTSNRELRPLVQRFSSRAGLADVVDETIGYCLTRALLPDLLAEVQQANPRQYALFAPRLRG